MKHLSNGNWSSHVELNETMTGEQYPGTQSGKISFVQDFIHFNRIDGATFDRLGESGGRPER